MTKIVGVVAEYNPFHKGHLHHIAEAKRLTGADAVVCVMSGDFVQRGEPAILDKYVRARTAVSHGVDLVIELPFVYAVGGAELFSSGAVRLLNGLGIVDTISFGMESLREGCGPEQIEHMKGLLSMVSRYLAFEPGSFGERLREYQSLGLSYPLSREKAVADVLGKTAASLLKNPNDGLGVDYLTAMTRLHAKWELNITDVAPVPRKGAGLHEQGEEYAGATAIRELLREGKFKEAAKYLPNGNSSSVFGWPKAGVVCPSQLVFSDNMFEPLIFAILGMKAGEAQNLYAAGEGLENRLLSASMKAKNMEELVSLTKSKRYTRTRIQRLILHALTGLTKDDVAKATSEPLYARVLGMSEKGPAIIRRSKKVQAEIGQNLPFITSVSRQKDILSQSPVTNAFDVKAAKIWTMLRDGNLADFRYSPNPKG
ncbi:MAG: nucleotidyltransferase family protein [Clostridiales Family XIII bacterium]|jgi:predicted nucleotidyltransferase|nr:nucleotidyltransferase family protein [Clostridiales Family XIII bacterium]